MEIVHMVADFLNPLDYTCFRICCKDNLSILEFDLLDEVILAGDLGVLKYINPEKTQCYLIK